MRVELAQWNVSLLQYALAENRLNCFCASICVRSLGGNGGLEGGEVGGGRWLVTLRPGRVLHRQETWPGGAPQVGVFGRIYRTHAYHLIQLAKTDRRDVGGAFLEVTHSVDCNSTSVGWYH